MNIFFGVRTRRARPRVCVCVCAMIAASFGFIFTIFSLSRASAFPEFDFLCPCTVLFIRRAAPVSVDFRGRRPERHKCVPNCSESASLLPKKSGNKLIFCARCSRFVDRKSIGGAATEWHGEDAEIRFDWRAERDAHLHK